MRPVPHVCPHCKEGSYFQVADYRDGLNGLKVWVNGETGNRHECDKYPERKPLRDPVPLPAGQPEKDAARLKVLSDQLLLSRSCHKARFDQQQQKAAEDFERAQKQRASAFAVRLRVLEQEHKEKMAALSARIASENQERLHKREQILAELAAMTEAQIDEIVNYEADLTDKRLKRFGGMRGQADER